MSASSPLLVQIMFVMLLTMGVGKIVTVLAALVDPRTQIRPDAIHTSWVVLLLMVHLNVFWHVREVWTGIDWTFPKFLYVVAGGMLMYFATNLLLPDTSSSDAGDLRAYYFGINRQFFLFLGFVQGWAFGTDLVMGRGFTIAGGINLVAVALAVVLIASQQPTAHRWGAGAAWLLYLGAIALRGLGTID
jgi:hypothetical protein